MMRYGMRLAVAGLAFGASYGMGVGSVAEAQSRPAAPIKPATTTAAPAGPEQRLLQALASNPETAPYQFSTVKRDGKISLRGRVGTKQVHDAAIGVAIDSGLQFSDDLVIDTAEANRVAEQARPAPAPTGTPGPSPLFPNYSAMSPTGSPFGLPSLVYPSPLFGRIDDPFYGLEPPLVSFPPWWGALTARRLGESSVSGPASTPVAPPPNATAESVQPEAPVIEQPLGGLPENTVEMTIDPLGVGVLRGNVPTLADKIAVGQKLARSPGISRIINNLTVRQEGAPATDRSTPPPPPEPVAPGAARVPPPPRPLPAVRRGAPIRVDQNEADKRLERAFSKRPALAGFAIQGSLKDGVATLSGKVPTVYEAMIAYRAAQLTPGVRSIVDHIEFAVPDGEHRNPLLEKGRPEDVEPYVAAQIRRQLGDQVQVDRVRVSGDLLEVSGAVQDADERARAVAVLRSMPILRGFRIDPDFHVQ